MRVPWTARRSNQSILKEINPEYSLEELMLKLKFQYFGHLMWRADSLEKTLMLVKIEGRRRRRRQRMRWLDGITDSWAWVWVNSGSWWWTVRPGVLQSMELQRAGHDWATELNWIELNSSFWSYPGSSAGKESTCNAGDPGLISGLGRSPGEGIGYPLQYSWASLVAWMVKNSPAMWETWVPYLGWEDLLEDSRATHSTILAWRIPMHATVHGVSKSLTWLSD